MLQTSAIFILKKKTPLNNFFVQAGDLLFTRYNGSKELISVNGVFKDKESMLHPDKLIRAHVVDNEMLEPDYLAIGMNAGEGWRHITRWVKTSAGQHGIAGTDIKRAPFPLPPLSEQRRIVDLVEEIFSQCSTTDDASADQLRHAFALRQATLKSAFAGELVPQDPTDEPASVLLERIAAERAAQPVAPRRGRKKKSKSA